MSAEVLVPVPIARGARGAVVAPHHLATAAGLGVLRAGGSAVDAAIATNAALAVVAPNNCGIGGDAFWLIWDQGEGRLHALNGSGRAPAAASADRLRQEGYERLPFRGPLTITVPGAVRSWGDAHARFGRLSRDAVLGPAIELARDGFPAWEELIAGIERTLLAVEDQVGHEAALRFGAQFREPGRPWRPGERIHLPALAATLALLASDGFDSFYDGELGERQARFLAGAGSPIRVDDVMGHRSTWGEPLWGTYRDANVATHPPNSSGMVALEILGILGHHEPPARDRFVPEGLDDTRWVHVGIEASKLALADRNAYLADPVFARPPVERLLSPLYTAELAAVIDPDQASVARLAARLPAGTIYLAVVDEVGNAVSLIESNWNGFGSGVVDPATGIHYHNRGRSFRLEPDHPNLLEPGKRPLHTLLPWMLFRGGNPEPWVVGGSMGGDAQPQIAAQVICALVDGGVDVRTAVSAPRWQVEPREHVGPAMDVHAESRFSDRLLDELAAKGHPIHRLAPFDADVGHCHAIELVDRGPGHDGSLAAATDPRSAGLPAVW
ncbi:MAG TPA: gamma-glutamyltransferase family protein [Candidatus Limnocylindrales bacterium]